MGQDPVELRVSRKVGYAAVKPTAPAYSFGSKHDRASNDPGPGPGSYEPLQERSRKGGVFGSSSRAKGRGDPSPSPQDYCIVDKDLKKAPGYTFRIKQQPDHLKSKTPGPGAYDPGAGQDLAFHQGAPAVSIGHRPAEPYGKNRSPGPEYNPDYRVKEQPGVTIKFRHERAHTDEAPGPGQYDVQRAYSSPLGKTFGVVHRSAKLDNGVPGPIYSLDAGVEATRRSTAAWSMAKSPRNAVSDNGVPGPATYGAHAPVVDRSAGHGIKSHERSAPAYSIPGKPYIPRAEATPGPSDYNPNDLRKSAPAFSLHGSEIKDSRRKYPGPGHYQPEQFTHAIKLNQPAISIGHRPAEPCGKNRSPGPNAYNPDYRVKEQPGVTIKFRHERLHVEDSPAPHDYQDPSKSCTCNCCEGKGYTFGVRHKESTREAVPGPQYAVGCSTLGVAAAPAVPKSQLSLHAVL